MKKIIIALFLISMYEMAFALDSYIIEGVPVIDHDIQINGHLKDQNMVSPGETIFSILSFPKANKSNFMSDNYIYKGRTGDNTFDIVHEVVSTAFRSFNSEEKVSVFIDAKNPRFSIKRPTFIVNCSPTEKIILDNLSFEGNDLKFKLNFPDCLRKR